MWLTRAQNSTALEFIFQPSVCIPNHLSQTLNTQASHTYSWVLYMWWGRGSAHCFSNTKSILLHIKNKQGFNGLEYSSSNRRDSIYCISHDLNQAPALTLYAQRHHQHNKRISQTDSSFRIHYCFRSRATLILISSNRRICCSPCSAVMTLNGSGGLA